MNFIHIKRLFFLTVACLVFMQQVVASAAMARGDQEVKGHVKIIPTKYLKANNICSNEPDSDINLKLFNRGFSIFYTDSVHKRNRVLYVDKDSITAYKTLTCAGTFNQTGSTILGTLEVTGSAVVDGDVTLKKGINFTGPVTITGATTVTGSTTLNSVSASSLVLTNSSIHVDGTVAIGLTSGNHDNKVIKSFQHGDFLGTDVVSSSTLMGWSYVNTFSAKNIYLDVYCSGVIYDKVASSIAVPFNYTTQILHFTVPGPTGGSISIAESTNFPAGFNSYTLTSTAYQNSGSNYSFALTTSGANVVAVGSFLIETKSMGVVRLGNEYLGTPV